MGLNLFAIAVARDEKALSDPVLYRRNSPLRRILGSVTVGGPLPGDSAGAGTRKVTDHVAGNVKLRLIGSRDRRDHGSDYARLDITALNDFQSRVVATKDFMAVLQSRPTDERRQYEAFLAVLRAHPELGRDLLAAYAGVASDLAAINDAIDRSFVLTLDLTTDLFADELGADRYGGTLIADMGQPFALSANLGYRSTEERRGDRTEELEFAAGASWRWFRSSKLVGPVTGR